MKKPSERIEELRLAVVDEMARRDEANTADAPLREFLRKISGTTKADMAEYRLKDPWVTIAAIIAYLDEAHEKNPT
jgi:hypothetical protein